MLVTVVIVPRGAGYWLREKTEGDAKVAIDVFLRGQSNADFFANFATGVSIPGNSSATGFQLFQYYLDYYLGRSDVILAYNSNRGSSGNVSSSTALDGVPLIADAPSDVGWLVSNGSGGWTNNTFSPAPNASAITPENTLYSGIGGIEGSTTKNVVLWLWNESDTSNGTSLTASAYESAFSYDASNSKAVFASYGNYSPTTYVFVNPIPFWNDADFTRADANEQAIKQAFYSLSGGTTYSSYDGYAENFNAYITASNGDVFMNGSSTGANTGYYGGPHLGTGFDIPQLAFRAAVQAADALWAQGYAVPGAPVTTSAQLQDPYGPTISSVTQTGASQLTVGLSLVSGAGLLGLSSAAASGRGWTVIENGVTLQATSAAESGSSIVLNFGGNAIGGLSTARAIAFGRERIARIHLTTRSACVCVGWRCPGVWI